MARDGTVSRCNRRTVSHTGGRGGPAPAQHTPEHRRTHVRHPPQHPYRLERLTGIRERRVSIGDEDSFSLATAAAQTCLDKARCAADSVDVVISCSITKFRGGLTQWLEPTMSNAVAVAIGARQAMTFDVSNACAGMLTGVMIANNWIRQGTVERVLLVSGEYISQLGRNAASHIRTIVSRELASLTLGDAGAALLLERAPTGSAGITLAGFTTVADYSRLCVGYPNEFGAG